MEEENVIEVGETIWNSQDKEHRTELNRSWLFAPYEKGSASLFIKQRFLKQIDGKEKLYAVEVGDERCSAFFSEDGSMGVEIDMAKVPIYDKNNMPQM